MQKADRSIAAIQAVVMKMMQVLAKQNEPLCWGCFDDDIRRLIRKAVRLKGLIRPGDRVLAAVSGGAASLALVRLLMDLCNTNPSRAERGQVAFRLEAVHVDEGAAHNVPPDEAGRTAERLRASLARAGLERVPLHCIPLERVFDGVAAGPATGPGLEDGAACAAEHRDRLVKLLAAVEDATGREDLMEALRHALLIATAARLGCNRVARGDCASLAAVRTIAQCAKGAGFALPASIQHCDARAGPGQPAFVSPLRDVAIKDLALFCHHHRLEQVHLARPRRKARAKASLNRLAAEFVAGLQAALPSTVPTILRTACKLQAR